MIIMIMIIILKIIIVSAMHRWSSWLCLSKSKERAKPGSLWLPLMSWQGHLPHHDDLDIDDDIGSHEDLATDHDDHDDLENGDESVHNIYDQGPSTCPAGRWQWRLRPHFPHIDLIWSGQIRSDLIIFTLINMIKRDKIWSSLIHVVIFSSWLL